MGSTANYSWPTPVATDLVKDGWEAIKDLGDAADTTVKAVADAQGLVLINTTNYSAVASQSINDVFSATYDKYVIYVKTDDLSASSDLYFKLRASGTDSSASYVFIQSRVNTNSTGATVAATAGTAGFYLTENQSGTTNKPSYSKIEIVDSFASTPTTVLLHSRAMTTSGLTAYWIGGGFHNVSTSYDGITVYPNSGTMTGTISIYGLKD